MLESDLIFQDADGHIVVLMHHIASRLHSFRQTNRFRPESGGVLIGERRGKHIILTDLSVPGEGDIQSRFKFDRKGAHHQEKVNSSFYESGGISQYVGEWPHAS